MPKNWRKTFVKENNGHIGRDPEYGAIFMSNSSTRKECLNRGLFGLPHQQADFVTRVKCGMVLFLFDYDSRELHGVFQACSDGAMNIVPTAFCSSGKPFPAQVKFTEIWHCRPLCENEFREAIRENYFSGHKFNFGLSEVQVQRLLTLFSSKKLERSAPKRTVVTLPTRQHASYLNNATGDYCVQNNSTTEADGNMVPELAFRVASPGNCFSNSRNPVKDCRSTAPCGLRGEPDVGQEYNTATGNEHPRDASGEFRRLSDQKVPGVKDLLGNECGMDSNFGRYAPFYSRYSLNTNISVPENLRLTESGRSENEHRDKDDIAQVVSTRYPSFWSNRNQSPEHHKVSLEADPQVLLPRRVPLEPPYATNREKYNLSHPRFVGDATTENTLPYDPDAPYFNSMDLSSCATNANLVSGQRLNSRGGYAIDTLPFEKVMLFPDEQSGASKRMTADFGLGDYVPLPSTLPDYPTSTSMTGIQPFSDEHSGASKHMATDFGLGDYVPLPTTVPDYPTSTSMIGVAHSEAVSTKPFQDRSTRGRSHHLPRPDVLTSAESGENVRNFKSLAFSSSPSMYPSFLHHLSSGDGVDLPPQERVNREIPAYRREHDFRDDAPDFNNRVGWSQDHVNRAAPKTQGTRRSVFSRLTLPPKKCDAKGDTSHSNESVDEVMSFLHECHEDWLKQKTVGPHTRNLDAVGELEMEEKKTHTDDLFDDDPVSPAETTLHDVLASEESMYQPVPKAPFIDFKRRSERQKSLGNLTQGCKDYPVDPAPQHKKRKLVRPKLIAEVPLTKNGNHENPVESAPASSSVCENKVDTGEVLLVKPVDTGSKDHPSGDGNTAGHNEEMLKREEGKEDALTL